jgi:diguanylate cyclase (GGDEF)-like protein
MSVDGAVRNARVLIVDDEPANIHGLAAALGANYDLRFATGGERALALTAELAFDLVLLDVVMPGLDGYEVLRRLKADAATRDVPVIFVTSKDDVADEERGFALGAVDYIAKPISAPIVRARVRTHLELKRQRDLLEQRALVDPLTGVANRRGFDEALERRWQASLRERVPLLLVLLDVDHFKLYNDHYGHGAGDDCLRRIGAALNATFDKPGELAARVGGEEFALLLPGGGGDAPLARLLDAIRGLAIPHAHSAATTRVSVSAGAIEAVPTATDSPRTLLEAADKLLYQAKREGRNRAVAARGGTTATLAGGT